MHCLAKGSNGSSILDIEIGIIEKRKHIRPDMICFLFYCLLEGLSFCRAKLLYIVEWNRCLGHQ